LNIEIIAIRVVIIESGWRWSRMQRGAT